MVTFEQNAIKTLKNIKIGVFLNVNRTKSLLVDISFPKKRLKIDDFFFRPGCAYFRFLELNSEGWMKPGADLGGGGKSGRPPPPPPPPSGIPPPADPKGPPLVLFTKPIFGRPTLKFFERRLWRQYIITLRGSARQKNAIFLSKFSKKCPKTAFLTCFFKKLHACCAENLAKTAFF